MKSPVRAAVRIGMRVNKFRRLDLFDRCLAVSVLLHLALFGAYFINNLPSFSGDDTVYDAGNMHMENVEVTFIDAPPSVMFGGDSNPAPVEKQEWIEGSGRDRPDAESTDKNINKLSGDGTDEDGYMYSEIADHPPVPLIDFDPNRYFPPEARSASIRSKTVMVQLQINEDGSLKSARIISPPSGYGFDDAARKVVGRIRFKPGRIGGKAVKMLLQLPITFVLQD